MLARLMTGSLSARVAGRWRSPCSAPRRCCWRRCSCQWVIVLVGASITSGMLTLPLYGLYMAIYGRWRWASMPDDSGPHEPPGRSRSCSAARPGSLCGQGWRWTCARAGRGILL